MNSSFDSSAVWRALVLGFVVFAVFILAGGLLWWLGMALGLPRITAFLAAMCLGPLLVAGGLLAWVFSMPLARRQRLMGVKSTPPPAEDDQPPAA